MPAPTKYYVTFFVTTAPVKAPAGSSLFVARSSGENEADAVLRFFTESDKDDSKFSHYLRKLERRMARDSDGL